MILQAKNTMVIISGVVIRRVSDCGTVKLGILIVIIKEWFYLFLHKNKFVGTDMYHCGMAILMGTH